MRLSPWVWGITGSSTERSCHLWMLLLLLLLSCIVIALLLLVVLIRGGQGVLMRTRLMLWHTVNGHDNRDTGVQQLLYLLWVEHPHLVQFCGGGRPSFHQGIEAPAGKVGYDPRGLCKIVLGQA